MKPSRSAPGPHHVSGGSPDEIDRWRIMTISAAALFPDRLADCREACVGATEVDDRIVVDC